MNRGTTPRDAISFPTPNNKITNPNIVRLAAFMLIIYGLAAFFYCWWLLISTYITERGLGMFVFPFIFGVAMLSLVGSFKLLGAGDRLLKQKMEGAKSGLVGIALVTLPFFLLIVGGISGYDYGDLVIVVLLLWIMYNAVLVLSLRSIAEKHKTL